MDKLSEMSPDKCKKKKSKDQMPGGTKEEAKDEKESVEIWKYLFWQLWCSCGNFNYDCQGRCRRLLIILSNGPLNYTTQQEDRESRAPISVSGEPSRR
jgi:hypothetical protein